jgi:EAL domain
MMFDMIKLDANTLDRAAAGDEMSQAFLKGTVAAAKSIGARIVAKGIERVELQEYAVELGVDAAQGYLYAAPLSLAELLQEVASRRRLFFDSTAHGELDAGDDPATRVSPLEGDATQILRKPVMDVMETIDAQARPT